MTTPEPATEMTPLEYLACADKEWVAGNDQEAAGLIWKATRATFIGLAGKKGLDYEENFVKLAKALEADKSVSEGYYRGNLTVGTLMRDHAEMDVLEGYELESTYRLAQKFLAEQHGDLE